MGKEMCLYIFFSINLTNMHCTNWHRYFVKIKNILKCHKLKLLPDTYKVSGWHIKQYIKEKVESKKMITNKNINL